MIIKLRKLNHKIYDNTKVPPNSLTRFYIKNKSYYKIRDATGFNLELLNQTQINIKETIKYLLSIEA